MTYRFDITDEPMSVTQMLKRKQDMEVRRFNTDTPLYEQNAQQSLISSKLDFDNQLEDRAIDKFKNQDRFKNAMEDLGKSRQLREWASYGGGRGMSRSYADGGLVQDVQAKGFVPVQVSNGEYEFTPDQVMAIGAAMLAAKGQNQPPGIGFGPAG